MLTAALAAAVVICLAVIAVGARTLLRYRADRRQRGLFGPWPVRRIGADELDPRFRTGAHGPARDTEIRFIANYRVPGGISDFETWILCNLARTAGRIFEFGTATGKTAYLLAANAPADARITTLTLPPDAAADYRPGDADAPDARDAALAESAFERFAYQGTDVAGKIEQLYGDSKAFDAAPCEGAFDLVFVDGSHARSYVESDSRKALRMVRPGGLVIWHDYRGPYRTPDVFRVLNALARELPLVHVAETSLVAWRRPAAERVG